MPQQPPHKVRIIGGLWRSRLVRVIDIPGLRPTTDRIRETLFNWLGQNLTGLRCLDVFAGTGVLGFEAASRQADTVVLIERDKKAHAHLQKNLDDLQSSRVNGVLEILCCDGLAYLKAQPGNAWDLVFLDPPFNNRAALEESILEAGRVCNKHLGGQIYIEMPLTIEQSAIEVLLPDWVCAKQMTAGQVKAFLFRPRND